MKLVGQHATDPTCETSNLLSSESASGPTDSCLLSDFLAFGLFGWSKVR